MRLLLPLFLLFLFAVLHAATPAAAAPVDLDIVRQADLRIARIGERLAIANVALCHDRQARTGLVLHDIRQYAPASQLEARAAFAFERDISVAGVVPGSAADRAGIRQDAGIVSLDGEAVDAMQDARSDQPAAFARMQAVLDRMDALAGDGALAVGMVSRGVQSVAILHPDSGCLVRFQLVDGGVNAASDGRYVKINSAMYDFAGDDGALAAVLAHELAHNILDHRARLNAAGVKRGMLGTLGKSAGLIRTTEMEADRLSLYLLANAGFDPGAAIAFWDRMGAAHGYGVFSDGTHLRRGPRVALLKAEMAALAALRAGTPPGAVLIPALAKRPFPPLK